MALAPMGSPALTYCEMDVPLMFNLSPLLFIIECQAEARRWQMRYRHWDS